MDTGRKKRSDDLNVAWCSLVERVRALHMAGGGPVSMPSCTALAVIERIEDLTDAVRELENMMEIDRMDCRCHAGLYRG